MGARKHLKAVESSGEPMHIMTISEAAESGSRLAELRAMRRAVASRLDDLQTPAVAWAALSKRQMDISREIEELMSEEEGDELGKAADSPDETFNPATL